MQVAPIHQCHISWRIKNSFWKGSPVEHLYETRRIVKNLHVRIEQIAPINQSHVSWWIKISQTIFEKGYRWNTSLKVFQNLTCVLREVFFFFFRNFFMPVYSASSPHSPEPCFLTDENFKNSHVSWRIKISRIAFGKGHPRNLCEIISKSEWRFQRRFFKKFLMSV